MVQTYNFPRGIVHKNFFGKLNHFWLGCYRKMLVGLYFQNLILKCHAQLLSNSVFTKQLGYTIHC
jgi:hypothetical protein